MTVLNPEIDDDYAIAQAMLLGASFTLREGSHYVSVELTNDPFYKNRPFMHGGFSSRAHAARYALHLIWRDRPE